MGEARMVPFIQERTLLVFHGSLKTPWHMTRILWKIWGGHPEYQQSGERGTQSKGWLWSHSGQPLGCTICNNKIFGFVNVSHFAHSLFHNFWLKISFKSPWSHKFSITIFTTISRIWGNHVTICPSSLDPQFKYPAPPVKLHLKFRNWLISYNGRYFYKCLPDATSRAN